MCFSEICNHMVRKRSFSIEARNLECDIVFHPGTLITYMLMSNISTLLVAFALAAWDGTIDSARFFISVSFSRDPSRAVASFGMAFMALWTASVYGLKYLEIYRNRESRVCRAFANAAVFLGMSSCVLGIATAAVSLDTHINFHLILAAGMFTTSLLSMLFFCLLDRRHELEEGRSPTSASTSPEEGQVRTNDRMIGLRRIFFVICASAAIILGLTFHRDSFVGSVSELVVFASFCLFMATFASDLQDLHLRLSIVPNSYSEKTAKRQSKVL